jgi:hypothetical protein
VQVFSLPKSAASCNQPFVAAPSGTVANPTHLRIVDPDVVTRDCVWVLNQQATIFAVPVGTYVARGIARGATLASARSLPSNPFARVVTPAVPPAPTNLRIVGP